ncbi:MAG: hypothetical protein EA359_03195 [Balneolaceae bacterium]|nr:MAG: hypothetical protein EA359_03195 [Balneolaceae bacterium]
MTTKKNEKLNKLLSDWLPGTVYTSSWLREKGYGTDLLHGYKQSGWIRSFGRGAYARFNDEPEWEGGLYAIQKQLEMPVYVGGITALQLQGYAHYIAPQLSKCHLYTPQKIKLPKWFITHEWKVKIKLHISTLLGTSDLAKKQINHYQIPITIAAPERAILEMLSHVDSEASFIHAWQIMEGLTTLRPEIMQTLLELCNSIKVARLCLYMAEKNQLQWYEQLNKDAINVGSGKRSIVKDGTLNKNYQITVPDKFEDDSWI